MQSRAKPGTISVCGMFAYVISIVDDSLFGALDLSLPVARLREIAAVAARSGIAIPDASRFGHLPAHEFHSWLG
jgi:hypothetical protein